MRSAQRLQLSPRFPYQAAEAWDPVSPSSSLLSHDHMPFCKIAVQPYFDVCWPPCHSLHLHAQCHFAGQRTPGPADYKSDTRAVLPGKPAYTIAGRQGPTAFKHNTPGPGTYAVRNNSKLLGSHPNAPAMAHQWPRDRAGIQAAWAWWYALCPHSINTAILHQQACKSASIMYICSLKCSRNQQLGNTEAGNQPHGLQHHTTQAKTSAPQEAYQV